MYKTFDADTAEEKFAARNKVLNHWAMVVGNKLKTGDGEDEDGQNEDGEKDKKSKGRNFKISDMDDWIDDQDDDDGLDSTDEDEEEDKKKKNKKNKKGDEAKKRSKDSKKKGKKKTKAEEDGIEDSDDGDDEGREVDYMSDESSESDEELMERANEKGVDQDEGLSKMLDSDESEEEEEKDEDEDDDEDEDEDGGGSGKKSKNASRAGTPTPDDGENSNHSTSAADEKASKAEKRKAMVENLLDPNNTMEPSAKKARLSSSAPVSSVEAQFEEDVRKYLARKPMTTVDILKKFTQKKTGIEKDQLMPLLVNVLKRINPHKQKVKGNLYFSLKK